MAIIYKSTSEAQEKGWDWDTILYNQAIETVEEFDSYEEAVKAFEKGHYDEEVYGVF